MVPESIHSINMTDEAYVRFAVFLLLFILIAIGERLFPRRILSYPKMKRWFNNLSIVFLDTLLIRFLFPLLPVGFALYCAQKEWGLLNMIALPLWIKIVIGVIVLDFIIYLQHVMFHTVPLLWRLHVMHHSDLDFDMTTGLRFHPLEIFLSMVIKLVAVLLLGPPATAVLIFEILLNGTSMFNHGNIHIPFGVDKILRLFVVTPDMHRVHHSVIMRETNSNYGFNLPWWDRLLGTYRAQPARGHEGMTIGIGWLREAKRLTLPWLLAMPFTGTSGIHYSKIGKSGR
jgi:sterol desaturase/sphingolipid hydroxylase (fatty acid hydroxylase superfamily)